MLTEHEELLARLRASMKAICESDSPQLAIDAVTLSAAQRIESLLPCEGDLDARFTLGWLHWHMSRLSPPDAVSEHVEAAIGFLTPCFVAGLRELPEDIRPQVAERAVPVLRQMLQTAMRAPAVIPLSEAIDLGHAILAAIPDGHPMRSAIYSNNGGALRARFLLTGATADLDASVEAQRAALRLAVGSKQEFARLANLASSLTTRFERYGEVADLDAAVDAAKSAEELAPEDDPLQSGVLFILSEALTARFVREGNLADADDAIKAARGGLRAVLGREGQSSQGWSRLAHALRTRFERTGDIGDIDEAVDAARSAARAVSRDHPDWAGKLSNLCGMLVVRYRHAGRPADGDEAVAAGRASVGATSSGSPLLTNRLLNLANAHEERLDRAGDPKDAGEAIRLAKAALASMPAGHPNRPGTLHTLAKALSTRAERTGSTAELDEAVKACRAAAETAPAGHPHLGSFLTTLTGLLITRYGQAGALDDAVAAIKAGRAAIDVLPVDHPSRPGAVSNLLSGLHARYGRLHDLADLDEAIKLGRAETTRDNSQGVGLARCLRLLGLLLGDRFDRTGDLRDLDEAVAHLSAALQVIPKTDYRWAGHDAVMANLLRRRYEAAGHASDLEDAITSARDSVDTTPLDDWSRAARVLALGRLLLLRYGRTRAEADRRDGLSAFKEAADDQSGLLWPRIRGAQFAADLLVRQAPGEACELLESAVGMLAQLAPRRLAQDDQQKQISGYAGLVGDAAAVALMNPARTGDERAAGALRLLETGNAVLMSQAVGIRHDLTELAGIYPDLAGEVDHLRECLEADEVAGEAENLESPQGRPWAVNRADRRRRQADDLASAISKIRKLDGFESFGGSPSAAELTAQARAGPVVTFNISRYRSDALIMTESDISAVALPALTLRAVTENAGIFHEALKFAAPVPGSPSQLALLRILEWLWDAAAGPVIEALEPELERLSGPNLPRVWWIPGGLLGMLPIHAAGYHSGDSEEFKGPRSVMERVVSSYTPTVRTLSYARRRRPAVGGCHALLVAMPETPGMPEGRLSYVLNEVERIRRFLPDHVLLIEPGNATAELASCSSGIPTRENVYSYFRDCQIAHFSCHGISDSRDPSQSRLLLIDHAHAPLTVASLAPTRNDTVQLVYLSACDTARSSSTSHRDEAIHLSSAFQVAGARHVVGTLWEISDKAAADVAEIFYRELDAGRFDFDRSAYALHKAVSEIRDWIPEVPSLWAPFIHAGS
jgi:tetratricopeptide (TPR) repeat protein